LYEIFVPFCGIGLYGVVLLVLVLSCHNIISPDVPLPTEMSPYPLGCPPTHWDTRKLRFWITTDYHSLWALLLLSQPCKCEKVDWGKGECEEMVSQ
jgi:hypothetical protein